jgi:hypothetical protein
VAGGPGGNARLPATLQSPERSWRAVTYAVLALLAAWYFAVRHGSVAGVIAGCVLAATLLAAAWRVLRARVVADSQGLTDYRAVRTVRVRWADVAGFDVARPGGPWGGFCVRAIQHAGQPVDLLATRGYSLLPSRASYDEVHRMMWTLDELRPTEPQ